jgi:hypothetical protein
MNMKSTEHSPKTPRITTGFFAMLGGWFAFRGTRAPSVSATSASKTRLLAALATTLCALASVLTLGAGTALAAPPEAPVTEPVTGVTASTATFHGVLDPNTASPEIVVEWTFLLAPRAASCEEVFTAPEPSLGVEATATGAKGQPAEWTVSGAPLEANTPYAVCLATRNHRGEAWTLGNSQTFTTPAAAPTILRESVPARSKNSATLAATVNPNNEETKYEFEYSTSPTLAGATTIGAGTLEGFGEDEVTAETGEVLTEGTVYYYRVVAENAAHEKTAGTIEEFKAAIPPETPAAAKVKAGSITATSAEVEGELNHLKAGEKGTFEVIYKVSPLAEAPTGECEESATPGPPVSGALHEAVGPLELESLQPNAKYTFCLRAHNEAGEVATGAPVTFTTTPAPPEIFCRYESNFFRIRQVETECTLSENARAVTSDSATLEAGIDANNQPTEYEFEYATSAQVVEEGKGTVVKGSPPAPPLEGSGPQPVSVETGPALAQNTGYYFRVLAQNAKGEAAKGKVERFATVATAHTDAVSEVSASTATFNGHLTLTPLAGSEYSFDYKANSGSECAESSTADTNAGVGSESASASVQVTGLTPSTEYGVCLVSANAFGSEVGPVVTFTTPAAGPAAVLAGSESASEVTGDSAILGAQIVPNGAETSYRVEYGTSAAYGEATNAVALGASDDSVHAVRVPLQGLAPGRTYHYRVLAENEHAKGASAVAGPDQTFTTERAGETFQLPDDRAYEMVTPPQKQGALFADTGAIRAAASGDAIADIASVPIETRPEGNANEALSVLSARGATGWSSREIAAPHLTTGLPVKIEDNEEYTFFSEDLSGAVLESGSPAFEKLSTQASEPTPYLRTIFAGAGASEKPCTSNCYAPLVSPSDDTANPLEPFGELKAGGLCQTAGRCGPAVRGGTPDLSQLVLSSPVPLTATPAPSNPDVEDERQPDLYEYSAGQLQLLSILPEAQDPAQEGSLDLELAGRSEFARNQQKGNVAARHAISNDGNRVVLEQYAPSTTVEYSEVRTGLYLRDVAKGKTIRLDEPTGEAGTEASIEPEYMDANSEGTRIFFLDGAKLTADSGATAPYDPNLTREHYRQIDVRPDLYECEISEVDGHDKCELTDLTPKINGESARVASVLGASEDGSYVYFAAGGGLGIAPAGGCAVKQGEGGNAEGEVDLPAGTFCNVYVRHDGVTRFVTRLSQQDASDWANGGLLGSTVRVSPNGEWLAFLSQRGLTGYDTHGTSEAYLYHAPADLQSEAGTLSCASCNPTGSRPAGGASVPGWPGTYESEANFEAYYQPRYLSDEGRLFFNSPDPLVPLDVSKQSEVYEYEPEGTGNCAPARNTGSSIYQPARAFEVEGQRGEAGAGCVALISTGTAAEGSQFLEAAEGSGEGEHGEPGSTGGRDVFFLTTEKVLPQDVDTAPDVYDAHECTSASPCISVATPPPPCTTEASCKAPPTPQPTIYAAPASATFSGPGNLVYTPTAPAVKSKGKPVKCRRGFTRKHGKCTKVKAKKKHAAAKKASHDRRVK